MTTQRTAFEMSPNASRTRPWGTATLRGVLKIALLLTFVAVPVLSSMAQTGTKLQSYFKNIGLSQDQIAAIRSGQSVAKTLHSRIPDEIFVFGGVYIKAAPESYLKFAKDFDRMRKLPEFLAVGEFSNPPQLSDLKGLELDSEDNKALKSCKPGDCEIQMPTRAIEEIPKSVNWSASDVDDQVNQIVQKRILQGLLAYQRKGNQVLGVYNDKRDPTEVAGHFKYMLSYAKALPKELPDFYRYLLAYPASKPANVEDTFYWTKVKFGLKPTLRVVHVLILHGTTPQEPAYVIAEKQLYSSHYFETALDLTYCIHGSDNPKQSGFYLIKAMGSEQAGLTGFKGSIVRKVAVSRSASSLQSSLAAIKNLLEHGQ
jgi:hypothetical protein